MATQPIDYAALAEKARKSAPVDYAALAEQARKQTATPAKEPEARQEESPKREGFLQRGFGDLWDSVKGMKSLVEPPKDDAEKAIHLASPFGGLALWRMMHGYIKGTQQTVKQAEDAAAKGDNAGVLINSAAAGIPLVGPLVSGVYEQSGKGDLSGDVGLAASRVAQVASMAPEGSAIPNPAAGLARGVTAGIKKVQPMMADAAEGMYQRNLKPANTKNTTVDSTRALVKTGLENSIPISEGGLGKLGGLIDNVNDAIKQKVASYPLKVVSKSKVADRLTKTRDNFTEQVNPGDDLAAIDKVEAEFKKTQPDNIPAEKAQSLKVGTYRQLRGKYGQAGAAQVEAEKALARGLKEELEVQFPEIKGLNAQEAKFLQLDKALEKAVQRIAKRNAFDGKSMMLGAAGTVADLMQGGGPRSIATGTAAAVLTKILTDPVVQSRLAIAMHKGSKGSLGIKSAYGRVGAYANALGASGAQSDKTEQSQ